jgi:hypothetical protein
MLKELYAFSVERKKKKVLGKWVFGIERWLVMEGLVKMPDLMDGLIDALL